MEEMSEVRSVEPEERQRTRTPYTRIEGNQTRAQWSDVGIVVLTSGMEERSRD